MERYGLTYVKKFLGDGHIEAFAGTCKLNEGLHANLMRLLTDKVVLMDKEEREYKIVSVTVYEV